MNDSEEWKLTCLARHVLKTYRTKAERRAWLARWQKIHGKPSAEKVKAAVRREWDANRAANQD